MKYRQIRLSKQVLQNIMIFLDRVELRGLKEVQAMSEIIYLLTQNETENHETNKGSE